MPCGNIVDFFNHQDRSHECRVNNAKRMAPIGPSGMEVAGGNALLGARQTFPGQVNGQNGNQQPADPENRKEKIGRLSLKIRKIQMFNHGGRNKQEYQNN